MSRIPNFPDLVKSQTNNSFVNTEQCVLNGVPVSPSYPSGPWEAYYSDGDPTNVASISAIDPRNLTLARNRRPFFEDKYYFLRNMHITSGLSSIPYMGSGTIGSDEINWVCLSPQDSYTSSLTKVLTDTYGAGTAMDAWTNTLNTLLGEEVITFTGVNMINTIYVSNNVGGGISSWKVEIDDGSGEENAFWIAQRGGWGRNVFINEFAFENFGADGVLSSVYPNLHPRYWNPLMGQGGRFLWNVSAGYLNTPKHVSPYAFFANFSNLSPSVYKRHYLDGSSLIIESCSIPIDYAGDIEPTGSESQQTLGSSGNASEQGGTSVNPVAYHSQIYYQNCRVNHFGDGVARVRAHVYRPYSFSKELYYNYSGLNGSSVSSIIGERTVGNPQFSNNTAYTMMDQVVVGLFADYRINNMLIFDAANNVAIEFSSIAGTILNDYIGSMTQRYFTTDGAFNQLILTARNVLSGVSAVNVALSFSPTDGHNSSSPYIGAVMERTTNNYWGLDTFCMGIVTKCEDDYFNSDELHIAKKPTNVGISTFGNLSLKNGTVNVQDSSSLGMVATRYIQDFHPASDIDIGGAAGTAQYIPEGWYQNWQYFIVYGKTKADVLAKMHSLYTSGELDDLPTANDIPEVVRKRVQPYQAKNAW